MAGEAYETCDEFPFFNFIKLSVSGDNKWLIKSGQPGNLDQIAENIQSEYTELSGDKTTNKALKLSREIKYLEGRIKIINHIISRLQTGRVDELIKLLQSPAPSGLGFRFTYDDLETDLRRTITASKSDEQKLIAARHQYEQIPKGGKATEKTWYDQLSAIDKYRQSPPTNPRNITVIQFIAMETDYSAYISSLKANERNNTGRPIR